MGIVMVSDEFEFDADEVEGIKTKVIENITTRWTAKYTGKLPEGFDIELHKAVARAR